ncbi:exodeoxyribonuclease V subunit alpha [Stomatohabitans albus]|uniref:exodeoxyribonuclease V subunit alpha n=1 Tax=Stomatohabitans albus TaxID=3110766 RepID=UPI00300D6AF5
MDVDAALTYLQDIGMVSSGDVIEAKTLCDVADVQDETVRLAVVLALWRARTGHVLVDLAHLPTTFVDREGTVQPLPRELWPDDLDAWVQRVRDEPKLSGEDSPLVVAGSWVYLQRLYRAEQAVVTQLAARLRDDEGTYGTVLDDPLAWKPGLTPKAGFDLTGIMHQLFAPAPEYEDRGVDQAQLAAVHAVVNKRFTVISGGPGTGKTATVAKALSLVLTGFTGSGPDGAPVIKVAAFTGKAAARAKEALSTSADAIDVHHANLGLDTNGIRAIEPMTIARLIGMGWGITTQPKVNADNPIDADLIVLDEVSMVSLSDLHAVLAGTHPRTHVVLVGDHNQLPSIDAGQVMADLTGGAAAAGADDAIITLQTNYRSEQHINHLAAAVLAGDGVAMWDQLDVMSPQETAAFFDELRHPDGIGRCAFVETDLHGPLTKERVGVGLAEYMIDQRRQVRDFVLAGDIPGALAANTNAVVLAVHQRGYGSRAYWNQAMDRWFHELPLHRIPDDWVGRPVMVTANDRHIDVVNGDVGIVVRAGAQPQVALDGRWTSTGDADLIDLHRLRSLETVHAMTVHKSQGSEYGTVVVLLPTSPSPLMTRELLYTAITRAKKHVVIVGSREVLDAGIRTKNQRATGLNEGLQAALSLR